MNHRERFRALFSFEPVDRIPLYYFGTWPETKVRWKNEGLEGEIDYVADAGPQLPGMDPDWEYPMWGCHGLVNVGVMGDIPPETLEETDDYRIVRNAVGDVLKVGKHGSSIPFALEYGLKPTRESWEQYKKFLDPDDPRRRPANWEAAADALNSQDRVLAFFGGSLYGVLRNAMGVENISLLMYDDPGLLEEMTAHMCDMYMKLTSPVLERVKFDLVYIFEDCCGSEGPLFSPDAYRRFYDPIYRKLLSFYKERGVAFTMVDSDGKVDRLIPLWLESGFDIIFPVEVGKWKADPDDLRGRFGRGLRMFGAVDKKVISMGEDAIREHLTALKPAVLEGGFLPIPDHRIPPECSYRQMQTYIRVFHEIFG